MPQITIKYGDILVNSLLSSCKANNIYNSNIVSGIFSFTNTSQKLSIGLNNVDLIFTPIDTTNYNSVSATIQIRVKGLKINNKDILEKLNKTTFVSINETDSNISFFNLDTTEKTFINRFSGSLKNNGNNILFHVIHDKNGKIERVLYYN